jgi:hypothetical protein
LYVFYNFATFSRKFKLKGKKKTSRRGVGWLLAHGFGLSTQPSRGKRPTWWCDAVRSPHRGYARRLGGALASDVVATGRRQSVAGEHQWGPGAAPGKVVVSGTHSRWPAVVRWRSGPAWRRAPVVGGGPEVRLHMRGHGG